MLRFLLLCLLAFALLAPAAEAREYVPRDAFKYQRDLIRNARAVWGLDAPVATFAAQIHQESLWRPGAKSAYAIGLAQFTPDTADWISSLYKKELGDNQPWNPGWAIRALVRYDLHLYSRLSGVTPCDKMAFTLSAYNGGLGWVLRDKNKAKANGDNPFVYFGSVEKYNAGRAPAFFKENRGYPKRILYTLQPLYLSWGSNSYCI
jgi:soluble lytic murein transglycosylase-like protein